MLTASFRASTALFLFLLGLTASALIPSPLLGASVVLMLVLACLPLLRGSEKGEDTLLLCSRPKHLRATLSLFPLLLFVTATLSLLLSLLFDALSLPTVVPDKTPTGIFIAVFLSPLTEELLFRYLILGLFLPFGRRSALFVSAALFALAHGNFFQMPYAFLAGLLLGEAAFLCGSILFPFIFHVLNNAAVYVSPLLPHPVFFTLLTLAAALGVLLLFKDRRLVFRQDKEKKRLWRDLLRSPLPVYAILMLILGAMQLLP